MSLTQKIEIRELQLLGNSRFPGNGSDLRRSVTGIFQDNPVFHNHEPDGKSSLSAPQIRYIVDNGKAKLVSLLEGNHELNRLYEAFEESPVTLDVQGKRFPIKETVLITRMAKIGAHKDRMLQYCSISPWLALNDKNSKKYYLLPEAKKKDFLSKIFTANTISLAKANQLWIDVPVHAQILSFMEVPVKSGQIHMLGFHCTVRTNFILDSILGLGKMVSKGFGRFEIDRANEK